MRPWKFEANLAFTSAAKPLAVEIDARPTPVRVTPAAGNAARVTAPTGAANELAALATAPTGDAAGDPALEPSKAEARPLPICSNNASSDFCIALAAAFRRASTNASPISFPPDTIPVLKSFRKDLVASAISSCWKRLRMDLALSLPRSSDKP